MESTDPIIINLGEMLNLKDMGLDISSFQAIWNMIAGGIDGHIVTQEFGILI